VVLEQLGQLQPAAAVFRPAGGSGRGAGDAQEGNGRRVYCGADCSVPHAWIQCTVSRMLQ